MDATRPPSLRDRVLLYLNAAITTIVVVIGLWVGATRSPVGFFVVVLAIVLFAASELRRRRRAERVRMPPR
jgi:Na+/H+ antiporter NhaD/arsenite permease-like protein